MKEDLLDIRDGIKAGRYVNEATVSQGIVQRLLHTLGWPVYDTEVVSASRRVRRVQIGSTSERFEGGRYEREYAPS